MNSYRSTGFISRILRFGRFKMIKGFLVNLLILTTACLVLFFLGEFVLRTHQVFYRGVPFFKIRDLLPVEEFGWQGRKVFGDLKTDRYKIFVVGDSFTDCIYLGAENMYFSVLKEHSNVEVFAYGGGGYGTLQEYMVIDRYFDEIKPDLVVLQVTPNDFINNSWELEKRSFFNNNFRIRPYDINGEIVYRFPKDFGRLKIFLARHSRLLFFLQYRIERFFSLLVDKGLISSVEERIDQKGLDFHLYRDSVSVTESLIKKMKARIGEIPIVAFPVWGNVEGKAKEEKEKMPLVAFPFSAAKEWQRIFKENEIGYLSDIPDVIRKEEMKGRKLRMPDSNHWNKAGHEICGVALAKSLKRLGYLKP